MGHVSRLTVCEVWRRAGSEAGVVIKLMDVFGLGGSVIVRCRQRRICASHSSREGMRT